MNNRFATTGPMALLAAAAVAMAPSTPAVASPVAVTTAPHCSFVASGPSQNASEVRASVQLACFDGGVGDVTVCLEEPLFEDLAWCAGYENVGGGTFTYALPCRRGRLVRTLATFVVGTDRHRVTSEPRVTYCV